MALLGAHLSIAGGFHKAADAAIALGMETVQIFTHSPSQWAVKPAAAASRSASDGPGPNGAGWIAPPLKDVDVQAFRDAVARGGLKIPCAHSSYLINLASADPTLWNKSLEAFIIELERADELGLAGVVLHPGSALGLEEEAAIALIVKALDAALRRTSDRPIEIWLETTAGQGSSIGHRFEQIGAIIAQVRDATRIGVCVDTCHIFAAGYALGRREEYDATIDQLDRAIGLSRVRAFHLNDSKKPLGSRVDRHEHIGEGHLGLEPFRHVLNDPRFVRLPMYLETPKGKRDGQELDTINLTTLRSLMKPAPSKPSRKPSKRRVKP